jgi:hypothetical protein
MTVALGYIDNSSCVKILLLWEMEEKHKLNRLSLHKDV